jgi:hypothetical protein
MRHYSRAMLGFSKPVVNVTFVGAGHNSTQATITPTFASFILDETGAAPTILPDDYVFVGASRVTSGHTMAAQGYTQVGTELQSVDTATAQGTLWYKKMGPTPDTTVSLASGGSAGSWTVVVLRDVNTTTPLDVAVATATGINGAVPNCPTITPVTPGAAVIGFGMGAISGSTATALTIPANGDTQTNRFKQGGQTNSGTTARVATAVSMKIGNGAAAFDLATFGGGVTTNTGSWAAFTIAVRPR